MDQPLTCRITTLGSDDIGEETERLVKYYKANSDIGNRVRDPLQLIHTVKKKKFYIVEDEYGSIHGVAACFDFFGRYKEAGGTRITKNGFNLQKILHWCRSINEVFIEPPDEKYFSIIAEWNDRSIRNTEGCGFRRWDPDDVFIREVIQNDDPSYKQSKAFFELDLSNNSQVFKNHAQLLLDLFHNPVRLNGHTGHKLRLILDFPLMRTQELREGIVERIARGEMTLPLR